MHYEFTKMQSLGNDFIVLDGVSNELNITDDIARRLADRHFGIGCDQVLLVQPAAVQPAAVQTGPGGAAADGVDEFVFRIFNHDGSEVEQCGNGARCLARFLYDHRLAKNNVIRARTRKLTMTLTLNPDESVTVEMGIPEFSPEKIPFLADRAAMTYMLDLGLEPGLDPGLDLSGDEVEISAVAIGNPHAVQRVRDIAQAPVAAHGPLIENHPRFPARVNAGFMQIAAADHIHLRVYERGAGETFGCGSGACAAVAAGINLGLLDHRVKVSLPGGDAEVEWRGQGSPVFLTGPAHTVFSGAIEL